MKYTYIILVLLIISCGKKLPEITADVVTEKTPHDTDDPAIWINKNNPEASIVFGTDKDKVNGGVYAFNLDGKLIREKGITGVSYPNNVDVEYGFKLMDSTFTDIMVFSEREKNQIRVFSVPDMKPLDNGGFKVFTDETAIEMKRPMGVAFYKNQKTGSISIFVSRKEGPEQGYLYQYELVSDYLGIKIKLLRKIGAFSGNKEIEAIAVDNESGILYYSDEGHCIRKYYADPLKGDKEHYCFGGENFKADIEGIAITKYNDKGFLIVSNQQAHTFNIFDIKTNAFIKELNLGTLETDGCDVTTLALGSKFPNELFVSMNDEKNFFFHDLAKLKLLE